MILSQTGRNPAAGRGTPGSLRVRASSAVDAHPSLKATAFAMASEIAVRFCTMLKRIAAKGVHSAPGHKFSGQGESA